MAVEVISGVVLSSTRIKPTSSAVRGAYVCAQIPRLSRRDFLALGSPETVGMIVGCAKVSTMPNLNAGILSDIPILVPTASLQNEYVEFIKDASAQVTTLTRQIEKLRQARHLCSPRLMSGDLRIA